MREERRLNRGDIADCLEAHYGLRVVSIAFLPLGNDFTAAVYRVVERNEERIDAGSIRALGGLMFVHRQAGNFRACEVVARHILTLAERHGLPVAAGWALWMLGWLAYEHDELDKA